MRKKAPPDPDWINEQTACEWLGVTRRFLIDFRKKYRINYTYLTGNRGLMYDRNDINKILDDNSVNTLTDAFTR